MGGIQMPRVSLTTLVLVFLLQLTGLIYAQESNEGDAASSAAVPGIESPAAETELPEFPEIDLQAADDEKPDDGEFKVFEYGPRGLDIRSRDGNYHTHIDWRGQFRFTRGPLTTPWRSTPTTARAGSPSTVPGSRWAATPIVRG